MTARLILAAGAVAALSNARDDQRHDRPVAAFCWAAIAAVCAVKAIR